MVLVPPQNQIMLSTRIIKVIYPPGCKDINMNLPLEQLVPRLDEISSALKRISQEGNDSNYVPLALYLVNDYFLKNPDEDVQLLVASSLADILRIYAPQSPFNDPEILSKMFLFFINQLKAIKNTRHPNYKRYCYLLENFVFVQSFNLCFESSNYQDLFYKLFEESFEIVHSNHKENIVQLFLDLLTPYVPLWNSNINTIMDFILEKLVETKKNGKGGFNFAFKLIHKSMDLFQEYIPIYFRNALENLSTTDLNSDVRIDDPTQDVPRSKRNTKKAKRNDCSPICNMILELYNMEYELVEKMFPWIQSMLVDDDEYRRKGFSKLVGAMFTTKPELYILQEGLWLEFLKRFCDASAPIRVSCVQYSMHFLIRNPQLKPFITEQLQSRQHDKDESVRYQVVLSIVSAGKNSLKYINKEMLSFVIDRSMDSKFKVRKEALLGLAQLYKQYILVEDRNNQNCEENTEEKKQMLQLLSTVTNKCILNNFQNNLEEKLLIEKILAEYFVPNDFPSSLKMKALHIFYCSLDALSTKAFKDILQRQLNIRKLMRELLDAAFPSSGSPNESLVNSKISLISQSFDQHVKAQEFIQKFVSSLAHNPGVRATLYEILKAVNSISFNSDHKFIKPPDLSSMEEKKKEIIRTLGFPLKTNTYYSIIKKLIDRVSPNLIDNQGLLDILRLVHDSLLGKAEKDKAMKLQNSAIKGLELVFTLSQVYPAIFYGREIFESYFLPFLWKSMDDNIVEIVLKIFINVSTSTVIDLDLEYDINCTIVRWANEENFVERLIDRYILNSKTFKQAKLAVKCLDHIFIDEKKRIEIFGSIIDKIKDTKMSFQATPDLRFHLIALGQIIIDGGHVHFPKIIASIIRKYVIQDLLLTDTRTDAQIAAQQEAESSKNLKDYESIYHSLSIEVKTKIAGIKLLVKWIQGLKINSLFSNNANSVYTKFALNSFCLLNEIIKNDGDINRRGLAGTEHEKAFLRLTAALAMLKISSFDALNSINDDGSEFVFNKYSATLDIMHATHLHTLAMCLLDKQMFVCDRFLSKLHKHLFNLNLTFEFMAILSLGGIVQEEAFKNRIKKLLVANIVKRRDAMNSKILPKSKLFIPECVLPFAIHLLANVPFYPNYSPTNSPELEQVQACLWFLLEPLVNNSDSFSFSFFKRTFDNIKLCVDRSGQSKLKKDPNAEEQVNNINMKMYCICDLALGLTMSKARNFVSKEIPFEPTLPAKYFSAIPPQSYIFRSYLPKTMSFNTPKRCELEEEVCKKVPQVLFSTNLPRTIVAYDCEKTDNNDNDDDTPANKKRKT